MMRFGTYGFWWLAGFSFGLGIEHMFPGGIPGWVWMLFAISWAASAVIWQRLVDVSEFIGRKL